MDLTQAVQLWWSIVVVNQGLPLCIGQGRAPLLSTTLCIDYSFLNCGGRVVLHL